MDSENVSSSMRGMRPRGDLHGGYASTTNSRSAVVGKCEVLAFYVGGAVDEYKLLHWVNAEACPLIRRLSEPCAGFCWIPEPVCFGIRPRESLRVTREERPCKPSTAAAMSMYMHMRTPQPSGYLWTLHETSRRLHGGFTEASRRLHGGFTGFTKTSRASQKIGNFTETSRTLTWL